MLVSPVERPVASAAYGFVRFLGGGLAPFAAGKLAEHFGLHVPFAVGAVAVVAAVLVLSTGHRMLAAADADMAGRQGTTTSPGRSPTSSAARPARSTRRSSRSWWPGGSPPPAPEAPPAHATPRSPPTGASSRPRPVQLAFGR